MEDEEKLKKAIIQAAASIWLDNLPLSKEYVEKYYQKRLEQKKEQSPKLVLRKDDKNGK